jgi:hypothetical protein
MRTQRLTEEAPMAKSSKRGRPAGGARRWVRKVQETSNAMDLPHRIFTRSPRAIAQGLKRAVTRSRRTKGRTHYHINRAGRGLARTDRARLQAAKRELRSQFGRPPAGRRAA